MSQPILVPARTGGDRRVEQAVAAAAMAARVYSAAERQLTALTASFAGRVLDGTMPPAVARRRLKRTAAVIIAATEVKIRRELGQAARAIQADAAAAAQASLARTGRPSRAHLSATVVIAASASWASLLTRLESAGATALRSASQALADALDTAQAQAGGTRRSAGEASALRAVLNAIAENGLAGYTDIAGRNWHLGTYARAAVLAAATRLHLSSQFGVYTANGADLVIVDGPSAGACQLCAPWVGAVLSLTGATPAGTPTPEGPVMGTVSDALSDGVGHPNCRHDFDPL